MGIAASEYSRPAAATFGKVELPSEVLATMLEAVAFVASKDTERAALNGVHLDVNAEYITVTATDGYRLGRARAPRGGGSGASQVILPNRVVSILSKLLSHGERVQIGGISGGKGQIGFRVGACDMVARLIDHVYPSVDGLLSMAPTFTAVADRLSFAQVLQRVNVMANKDTHRVEMEFAGGVVRFGGQSADVGDAIDQVPAEMPSGSVILAVNGEFLQPILAQVPGAKVSLGMSGPDRGLIIRPAKGALPDGRDIVYVVMPLR
jgi:DNA polymerase-3 subunit beta